MKIGTAGMSAAVVVAAVGLVAVVAVGLVSPGAAKSPPSAGACTITMDSGFWICAGSAGRAPRARASGTPTSSPKTDATESPSTTAAVKAASVAVVAGPPFPYPFSIGPAKPAVAGQPAPKARPILLMQLSAGLATAPASPMATVLLADWPGAGKGTVFVSVYSGETSNACSSPPLVTKVATVLPGVPATWSATFPGLKVGSYEVQAAFSGKAGPMSTPCGRSTLKVVAAPGSGQ